MRGVQDVGTTMTVASILTELRALTAVTDQPDVVIVDPESPFNISRYRSPARALRRLHRRYPR